eukprot:45999-Eustigmatos_ZCMA.PRE.1
MALFARPHRSLLWRLRIEGGISQLPVCAGVGMPLSTYLCSGTAYAVDPIMSMAYLLSKGAPQAI